MFDRKLQKYAQLVIRQGVNLQNGEPLVIASPIFAADLVREIAKEAYAQGASKVSVMWRDGEITKLGYENQTVEQLTNIPQWAVAQRDAIVDDGAAYVNIISEEPELMKGIDASKIAQAGRAMSKAMEKFRAATNTNKTKWCLVAYPNAQWAKKMFPELGDKAAVEKMWKYIHKTMRLDKTDPLNAWKKHQRKLERHSKFLNKSKIVSFHYTSENGTDFTIGMPKGYIFTGAVEKSMAGVDFTANMPTEEVFSSPDRMTANGKLVSAKPLVHSGAIIRDFSMTFKDGRIVDYTAEEGYDTLKEIIESDEGSHYLGEIALVGYNSPIQNLNTVFFSTLFDENASCHFAIGRGFPSCLKNGTKMTGEQLLEHGINQSVEHVDFMVGTADLRITAMTEDGQELTIFENGDWAI